MKKVVLENTVNVSLNAVPEENPIFSMRDGKLVGMIVHEEPVGWILRLGGTLGSAGYFSTREECIRRGIEYGHSFFVEGD